MKNKLIKNFCFDESNRGKISFSDSTKIRLNTENKLEPKVMLKAPYSTDDNIYFETWMQEPNGLMKWLAFEAIFKTKSNKEFVLPDNTSLGFKVKTTEGNYYWDGDSWEVAGLGDWNTEAEISANIESFPIASIGNKKIGFVVNLKTSNANVTPELFGLKLLGEFDVEYFDDLVYDSLIRLLNNEFRATSVVQFATGSTSISSIDLNSVLANKGYNIFDVESVYDLTNDPLKLTNLHDTYNVGAQKQDGFTYEIGTENFTAAIPANSVVHITFKYVPEISVKVNQDYYEVPSYPHISIPRITPIERRGFLMRNTNSYGDDFIRDKANGVAVKQVSPSQKTYRFDFMVHSHEIDQFRLVDALRRFFANTKKLVTWGLGNEHNIEIIEELDTAGNAKIDSDDYSGTNLAKGSFDVIGVLFFDQPSKEIPLVTDINFGLGKQNL